MTQPTTPARPVAQEPSCAATGDAALTLPAHARALAAELGGGPVAATLLALAGALERSEAERAALFVAAGEMQLVLDSQDYGIARLHRTALALRDAWRRERATNDALIWMCSSAEELDRLRAVAKAAQRLSDSVNEFGEIDSERLDVLHSAVGAWEVSK